MAAAGTCPPTIRLTADPSDARRAPSKRVVHHHHHVSAHFRPQLKPAERVRKIKRRPINFVSTDGTTSGDEAGEDSSLQLSGEGDLQARLEQLLRRHETSDLTEAEADCEDNNSTDVDAASVTGSIKHKSDANAIPNGPDTKVELLSAKIRNLEKQLATVLSINLKLREENDRLKSTSR
uniref:JAKMIP_CC3 domain-containing protein n=1 Tax=Panagrellus redivivus TaxID=6233 RepID=A0A7E4VVF5_PANRE